MALITQRPNPDGDAKSNFIAIAQAFDELDTERRLEVVKTGDVEIPYYIADGDGAGYSETVTLNLGYKPYVFAYLSEPALDYWRPLPVVDTAFDGVVGARVVQLHVYFQVKSTELKFYVDFGPLGFPMVDSTIQIKYVICREKIT